MNNFLATGRCLCEHIEYTIDQQPLTLYACHCTDCQTASGSSNTLILSVKFGCIQISENKSVLSHERRRANGKIKKLIRCPECLTPLWGYHDDNSKPMSVYAGTLDRSSDLEPIGHIWTRSAQPWVVIPAEALSYSEQPPDMKLFYETWANRAVSIFI